MAQSRAASARLVGPIAVVTLSSLPDELFGLVLCTLMEATAARAQKNIVCYPTSDKEVRLARRCLHDAKLAIAIGAVCRRFHRYLLAHPEQWVCCSRVLWSVQTFSVLRQLIEQPDMGEVLSLVHDADFAWVTAKRGEAWGARHVFKARIPADDGLKRGAGAAVLSLDAALAGYAVRGRYAAWHSDVCKQSDCLNASKRLLLGGLRQLLELQPWRTPSIWAEAQILLAAWLVSFHSLDELLVQHGAAHTQEESRKIAYRLEEVWDSMHNGVHNPCFWRYCRGLERLAYGAHKARLARVLRCAWNRALAPADAASLSQDLPFVFLRSGDATVD